MEEITLTNLDKKVDLVLQQVGFIKEGQDAIKEGQQEHFAQDKSQFETLTAAQTKMAVDIATLKADQLHSKASFNRGWGLVNSFISAMFGAGVAHWFNGK